MPAGVDRRLRPRRIVNWPHHEVQGADRYLLLAPRATVGLAGSGAGHTPDQEVSVRGAVRFPSTKWCRHGAGAFEFAGFGRRGDCRIAVRRDDYDRAIL